jgi:hypothetical protein
MRFSASSGKCLDLLYTVLREKKSAELRMTRVPDGSWMAIWSSADASLRDQDEEHHFGYAHEAVRRVIDRCEYSGITDGQVRCIADAIITVSHETKSTCLQFQGRPVNDESPCMLTFELDLGAYVKDEIVLGDATGPKLLKQLHEYLNRVAVECSKRALEFHRA